MSDRSEEEAKLAYRTALEAKSMASVDLNASKAAEQSALEAMARARSNAERIARLKARMEKLLQEEQAIRVAAAESSPGSGTPSQSTFKRFKWRKEEVHLG